MFSGCRSCMRFLQSSKQCCYVTCNNTWSARSAACKHEICSKEAFVRRVETRCCVCLSVVSGDWFQVRVHVHSGWVTFFVCCGFRPRSRCTANSLPAPTACRTTRWVARVEPWQNNEDSSQVSLLSIWSLCVLQEKAGLFSGLLRKTPRTTGEVQLPHSFHGDALNRQCTLPLLHCAAWQLGDIIELIWLGGPVGAVWVRSSLLLNFAQKAARPMTPMTRGFQWKGGRAKQFPP